MADAKLMSYAVVILGLLVIVGSVFAVYPYVNETLKAISEFMGKNDLSQMEQCGVTVPSQFTRLKVDLNTLILPTLFVGLPAVLLVLSGLMFLAGFYLGKSKSESNVQRKEERELIQKAVRKIAGKRSIGVIIPKKTSDTKISPSEEIPPPKSLWTSEKDE